MTSETVVQTERLVLRPFTLEDRDLLLKVFVDVDAQRFYPEMAKADMATKWIQRNLERYETDGVGLWALCLRETRELVGDCGLVRVSITVSERSTARRSYRWFIRTTKLLKP